LRSAKICDDVGAALQVDVLVVGSGASGLAAALTADRTGARVALVTKRALQSCNSAKAQGGIQAAVGEDDSPEMHAEDVWQSSHETADKSLIEVLTSEAQAAIAWLEQQGVEFTRDGNGTASAPSGYRLARCGGASRRRLLQVGDRTGHAITTALRNRVEASAIATLPHTPLVALAPTENGFLATCRRSDGARVEIRAATTILAAGGRCFREAELRGELSTNHPGATGETTDIAADLGAKTRDLDALQYHPNGGAWPPSMQGYSIPETTRAYGALLLNVQGERFVDELAPRDVVSEAIFKEVREGRGTVTPDGRPAVWLDTTKILQADADISLPYMLRRYRAAGIDPLAEAILSYPVLHYQNGGLVIDVHGATTVEGLYACGEIAGGTHGRNRMMGNSLLECCVFGRRAGAAAAEKAR
jgi:succinate dehydrogenase / fumarate reductase flavoprotein subunit/L-aspartate oxidase